MPRIAKFNYSDYSLLDSLYAQTGSIPTYSAISNGIASLIPDYVPSGTIISKYRNSWLNLRGLDSNSAAQTIQKISGERNSLVQQFQNIVSELETVEKNVTTVLSSPSELAFLEQKNEQLELTNQKLSDENSYLRGMVEGFQKSLDHVTSLLQQRDMDISIRLAAIEKKFVEPVVESVVETDETNESIVEPKYDEENTGQPGVSESEDEPDELVPDDSASSELKTLHHLVVDRSRLSETDWLLAAQKSVVAGSDADAWFPEFLLKCERILELSGETVLIEYLSLSFSMKQLTDFCIILGISLPRRAPKLAYVKSLLRYIAEE